MVECRSEKPGAELTDLGLISQCNTGQSQLSVQSLLRCSHSPYMQSHASASVRLLKIPNIGSHTIPLPRKYCYTLLGLGSRCFCGCYLPHSGKVTWVSCIGLWGRELTSAWKTSHNHSNKAQVTCGTSPGMRVNARYINSTGGCTSGAVYVPCVYSHARCE